MRRVSVCLTLLFALGIAHAASPKRGLIEPPRGWVRENLKGARASALGTVAAQWLDFKRGDEEFVEIGGRPSSGFDEESFARFYRDGLAHFGERIFAFRQIALCAGETGWYIKHRDPSYRNDNFVENVIFVNGSRVYFATYQYPPSLSASPDGERAIASLCVPSPVSKNTVVLPVGFTPPAGYIAANPRRSGGPTWSDAIAYYYNPDHANDVLMLMRVRANGERISPHDAAMDRVMVESLERANVHESVKSTETFGIQPLCGSSIGMLSRDVIAYGRKTYAYEWMILFGDTLYAAVYVHPANKPVYAPARAALSTLCPLAPSPSPSPTASPSPSPTPGDGGA